MTEQIHETLSDLTTIINSQREFFRRIQNNQLDIQEYEQDFYNCAMIMLDCFDEEARKNYDEYVIWYKEQFQRQDKISMETLLNMETSTSEDIANLYVHMFTNGSREIILKRASEIEAKTRVLTSFIQVDDNGSGNIGQILCSSDLKRFILEYV